MVSRKKSITTHIASAIAGSVIGGLVVGFGVAYFLSAFFSDGHALASSNQLNFNVRALQNIRNGDSAKAIEQLEMEAKVNLITAGAYENHLSTTTNKAQLNAIYNAKQYFEKYPVKYINNDEKLLIEQAYQKIDENSHNK